MTIKHIKRFFVEPNKSYFLFGPRGTGKSTLLKRRHPDALLIDLLLPNIRLKYTTHPEYLLEVV